MKQFTFILFFVAITFNVLAQTTTETKNHLVTPSGHGWLYEKSCINKWRVTFENKTQQTITSITFELIITNKESEDIVYQETHTVDYTLKAGERAASPYFDLSEPLCVDYGRLTKFSDYYSRRTQVTDFK